MTAITIEQSKGLLSLFLDFLVAILSLFFADRKADCKCNQGRLCDGGYQNADGDWVITYTCGECDKVLYTETVSTEALTLRYWEQAKQDVFDQTGYVIRDGGYSDQAWAEYLEGR